MSSSARPHQLVRPENLPAANKERAKQKSLVHKEPQQHKYGRERTGHKAYLPVNGVGEVSPVLGRA